MIKRLQNRVAESRTTLPVVVILACAVWLAAGAIGGQWWMQFVCFAVSTYLMVELNNVNALIRIYSRMMSCSFLLLSCTASFLFPSLGGAIVQLCFIASLVISFHCYQDKQSPGWTFYSFLCLGLASLVFVKILYIVPLCWLLMKMLINSLSWRTFLASLLGLAAPYWIVLCWLAYTQQFDHPLSHFAPLATFDITSAYGWLQNPCQAACYVFVAALAVTGTIHFLRNSIDDKIRIRQFYKCFISIDFAVLILLALHPQHFDMLFRMSVVCTSPLVGHFLALTHTRVTNIAFIVITVMAFILTVASLWMPSFSF